MKKLIYLFSVCFCLAILGLTTPSNISKNSGLTLIMQAEACSSKAECPDGSKIECSGQSTCEARPDMVICDGNVVAYC